MTLFKLRWAVLRLAVRDEKAIPLSPLYDNLPIDEPAIDIGPGSTLTFLTIFWAACMTSCGLAYLFRQCQKRWSRARRLENNVHTEWYSEDQENRRRHGLSWTHWFRNRLNRLQWSILWDQELPSRESPEEHGPRTLEPNREMSTMNELGRESTLGSEYSASWEYVNA